MTEIGSQKSEINSQWSVVRKAITLSFVATLLFALCFSASAQQQAKIPTIGYLGAGTGRVSSGALWRELNKLGYVEGKNIASEYRSADNNRNVSRPSR